MIREENPYASPSPLEEPVAPQSPLVGTQVFLASFLGFQAGGMLGLISACLAPLRYLMGPIPFETVLMEDLSSNGRTQILGESIFVLTSCLIFGATFGAILEIGEKCFFAKPFRGYWFLLSSLKIHRISLRGIAFAMVGAVPPILILTASHLRKDAYFWLHGLWAIAHLVIAIYFGERFAEACRRAEAASSIDSQGTST
jgi:hypothetical protein